jgi:tripartite-type tricarboxylate transporter receptor subunit TctC
MTASRRALLGAAAGLAVAHRAEAQADVTRIVVNFPPGGALDGTARLVADHAARAGRGTVVVENRPGAGGNLGSAAVARAAPDGKTLLAALDTALTVNPHLFASLGFDRAALVPVANLGTFQLVLLVHPGHPARSLAEFIAAARRQPLFYASGSVGSPGHLAMEHLRQVAGLPKDALEHVPQRGNAEALTALVSGTVPAGFLAIGGGPDLVRSGRLRALAVSGPSRAAVLPEVPTVAESGFPGFDVRIANMLFAPRGTPPAAIAAWSALAHDALSAEAARARLEAWGIEAGTEDPAALLAANDARWARVVREAGMRVE